MATAIQKQYVDEDFLEAAEKEIKRQVEEEKRTGKDADDSKEWTEYQKSGSWKETSDKEKASRNEDRQNKQNSSAKSMTDAQKAEVKAKGESIIADKVFDDFMADLMAKDTSSTTQEEDNAIAREYDRVKANQEAAATRLQLAKDNSLMENDLAELDSWSDEDKKAMEAVYTLSDLPEYTMADTTFSGDAIAYLNMQKQKQALEAKYGKERVREMLESMKRQRNAQAAMEAQMKGQQDANDGWFGASAKAVGATLGSAIAGPMSIANELAYGRTGRYSTLDPNNPGNQGNVYSSAVQSQVLQNIADSGSPAAGVLAMAYQGGMAVADIGATALATLGNPAASAALYASRAFTSTVSDVSARGGSAGQALAMGTATAAIEALTEKIPMDNLVDIFKGGKRSVVKALADIGMQGLSEAITEEASLFGTELLDRMVMQDKSSYNTSVADMVANGMSYEDARKQADQQFLAEVINTGVVSAIAGSAAAGGATIAGKAISGPQPNQADKQLSPESQRYVDQANQRLQEQSAPVEQAAQPVAPAQNNEQAEQPVVSAQNNEQTAAPVAPAAAPEKSFEDLLVENLPDPNAPEVPTTFSPEAQQQGMDALFQNQQDTGIKGTGAAESNFSQKPAYNAILSEDNSQADRRDDVRPMELPARDVNGGNVSAVTGNVYGAGVTPDEFASLMEEPTARGDFSYVPISNNEATQQAMENITRYGWQDAYVQWSNAVHQGRAGAEMSARGALFLNHAAQAGDRQQWLNILHDFQRLGTNTAQGLQAFRILRNLAPSDRLYMMRRSVDQMVQDMHLNVPIEIDRQLADQYQNAPTNEEADAILDEIIDDVAAQIPSTVADRWTALRYVNMLGNLRTQARNISGNIGAKVTYLAKDQIGATLEKVAHAFDPDFQRTKSSFVSNQLKALGRADFDEVSDIVLENGRFDDARRFDSTYFAREVNNRRRIFRTEFMESYRRLTNWAMNNDYFGDAGFARSAYARAFGGYLKANGFTSDTLEGIDQNLLDDARLYAIQQAQESTFRDHNAVSDWVSRIGRREGTPRAIRILSEGVMPFRRTPANVLVRAEEFSPLGIINTAVTAARAANPNSDVTGTDVVESMAKTLTGTGLFIMGAFLGKIGFLTGGPDPDEEKAEFDELNGYQNYALKLGDGWSITIDFLSPLAVPMFLGAELEKIISDGGYDLADFEKVFTSLADPMIQMSMLQGVNDSLDNIKYAENNLGQFLLNSMVSYLTQGIGNTLLGQLERSTEDTRQITYIDKDSNVPVWLQRQLGSLSQKIPGLDYKQTDYRNAWGQTEENEGGLLYNTLSPGYISREQSDQVSQELYHLRETTGENVFPDLPSKTVSYIDDEGNQTTRGMTEEEYQTYAKVQGQTARQGLEKLFASEEYQGMGEDDKVKAVNAVYNDAIDAAKASISDYSDFDSAVVEELQRLNAETGFGSVFHQDMSSSLSYVDKNGDEQSRKLTTEEYAKLRQTERSLSSSLLKEMLDNDAYSKMSDVQKTEAINLVYEYAAEKAKQAAIGDYHENASKWMKDLGVYKSSDIIEKVSYDTMNRAINDLFESHKEGFVVSNQDAADMDEVYRIYKDLPSRMKADIVEKSTGKTAKYLEIRDKGVSQESYMKVAEAIGTVEGTGAFSEDTKENTVRDIDVREAIANSGLSDREIDIVMKAYMSDSGTTEQKYDAILDMGFDAAGYVDVYRGYLDNQYKNQKIDAIMAAGNCDKKTATTIYKIFAGRYKPWE